MASRIVKSIVGSLGTLVSIPFMKEIIVFVISMCPVLELRGGLIAASLFNMNPIVSYIICIIGNIIPIPFILWLVNKVLNLRVFDDENGVMNKSILEVGGSINRIQYNLQIKSNIIRTACVHLLLSLSLLIFKSWDPYLLDDLGHFFFSHQVYPLEYSLSLLLLHHFSVSMLLISRLLPIVCPSLVQSNQYREDF